MFLNYFSLAILCIGLLLVFYTFIFIHEIPYEIAKKRNHPQVEAIYVACWLSLFTLHAIWPIVFLWAVAKPGPIRVAVTDGTSTELADRIALLEQEITTLRAASKRQPDAPQAQAAPDAVTES